MKKLNFLLATANLLVAVGFLIAISAYYIDPTSARLPVLAGFTYPIFALTQLLFIGIWSFRSRKWMLLPIGCLLLGWPQWSATFQLNLLEGNPKNQAKTITVATYNSKRFLVNAFRPERQLAKLEKNAAFLKDQSIDIFCFQESFTNNDFILNNIKRITGLKHHYSIPLGNGILSRYPIVNTFVDKKDTRLNPFIYADIKVGNDTIRVFNIHLQSLHFGDNEYDLLKNPTPDQKRETRSMLGKVLRASKKRSPQVQRIVEELEKSPHPIILCGDFNDPPTSYAYHQIARRLQDSFVARGLGIDATFAGPIPGLRIDYIMADDQLNILSHQVLKGGASDHYPVIVKVSL